MILVSCLKDRILLGLHRLGCSIDRAVVREINTRLGKKGVESRLLMPSALDTPQKIFLDNNICLHTGASFLISNRKQGGNFIVESNSGAAENLTVVTGNHQRSVDHFFMDKATHYLDDIDEDVIVHEEVWIGVNVTLLAGCDIGRGATIGAGAVVRGKIPPYAVVVGNPAKIVGFNFTPEEVLEHEKLFYKEDKRLPIEMLETNYKKYFLDHIKDIKNYMSLICK